MLKKPSAVLLWLLVIVTAMVFFLTPKTASEEILIEEPPPAIEVSEEDMQAELVTVIREFLESKGSPMAPDTEHILGLEHWRLLIAISAIESQYCKRQLGFNCWGIGGDSAYRYYDSYAEAATDADALITRWQERGRWHTVEDMNCHYVVPCNPNWVYVVNTVLSTIESYEQRIEQVPEQEH